MSFTKLPLEIKSLIWGLSLPEDKPEVCILWPLYLEYPEEPQEPYLVDGSFPVLMHLCRESRQFVLLPPARYRDLAPKFRYSPQADCRVPYRHFRPDLDLLYVNCYNYEMVIEEAATNHAVFDKTRHLAVEATLWSNSQRWFPTLVFKYLQSIETVSIVFPSSESDKYQLQRCAFQAPSRRCRLAKLDKPEDAFGEVNIKPLPKKVSFRQFIDGFWEGIKEHALPQWFEVASQLEDEEGDWWHGDAWNPETEEFKDIPHEAYIFEQFKRGEDGAELWEVVCQQRLLPVRWEPGRVHRPHNPEEWRVNDGDEYQPHRL